jgi:hypothetical protein
MKGEPIVMWQLRNQVTLRNLQILSYGRCFDSHDRFICTVQYFIAKWKIYPK